MPGTEKHHSPPSSCPALSTSSSHPLCSLILVGGPPVRTMGPRPSGHSPSSYPPTNHKAFSSSHTLGAQLGVAGKVPEWSWAHRGAFQTHRCLGPTPRFSFREGLVCPPHGTPGHVPRLVIHKDLGSQPSSALYRLCDLRKAV